MPREEVPTNTVGVRRLVSAILIAFLSLGGTVRAQDADWPRSIVLATASPGGVYLVYGQALARILSHVLKIEVTAEAMQGAVQNVKDLSDDPVYQIVKTVFENQDELVKAHPVAKETVPANIDRDTFLPIHPGALRYYREKGIAIPRAVLEAAD